MSGMSASRWRNPRRSVSVLRRRLLAAERRAGQMAGLRDRRLTRGEKPRHNLGPVQEREDIRGRGIFSHLPLKPGRHLPLNGDLYRSLRDEKL